MKKLKRSIKKIKHIVIVLFRNILSVFILLYLLKILVDEHNGYKWMWNSLLFGNLEFIEKNRDASIADRYEFKMGFFARYLNYINENTPDDAVILMPARSKLNMLRSKYKLKYHFADKVKVEFMIYPRRVVYDRADKPDISNLNEITHIAIVDNHGYERVNYNIKNKPQYGVFPLKK